MNITRILVPLDGSRLAETVLPAASSMAEQLGAQVLLLHVLEREPRRSVLCRAQPARRPDNIAGRLAQLVVTSLSHIVVRPYMPAGVQSSAPPTRAEPDLYG